MKKIILYSLLITFILTSCEEEDSERKYARINTIGVNNISSEGVQISAEIYDAKDILIEDHGFIYNLQMYQLPDDIDPEGHPEGWFEKQSLGTRSGNGKL